MITLAVFYLDAKYGAHASILYFGAVWLDALIIGSIIDWVK